MATLSILPPEILLLILEALPPPSLVPFSCTNKQIYALSTSLRAEHRALHARYWYIDNKKVIKIPHLLATVLKEPRIGAYVQMLRTGDDGANLPTVWHQGLEEESDSTYAGNSITEEEDSHALKQKMTALFLAEATRSGYARPGGTDGLPTPVEDSALKPDWTEKIFRGFQGPILALLLPHLLGLKKLISLGQDLGYILRMFQQFTNAKIRSFEGEEHVKWRGAFEELEEVEVWAPHRSIYLAEFVPLMQLPALKKVTGHDVDGCCLFPDHDGIGELITTDASEATKSQLRAKMPVVAKDFTFMYSNISSNAFDVFLSYLPGNIIHSFRYARQSSLSIAPYSSQKLVEVLLRQARCSLRTLTLSSIHSEVSSSRNELRKWCFGEEGLSGFENLRSVTVDNIQLARGYDPDSDVLEVGSIARLLPSSLEVLDIVLKLEPDYLIVRQLKDMVENDENRLTKLMVVNLRTHQSSSSILAGHVWEDLNEAFEEKGWKLWIWRLTDDEFRLSEFT